MPKYYTLSGQKIRKPESYAMTGAPMYKTKYTDSVDVNAPTSIYQKKYL